MSRMLNVIVLHWEDPSALESCLAHLAASEYRDLRVIVAENGSSARTRLDAEDVMARSHSWFRDLSFLQLDHNLGYAGGINAAVSYLLEDGLSGDVCILNPDVCVMPDTFTEMMIALKPNVGLVMCRTRSEDGNTLYDALRLSGFRQKHIVSQKRILESDYAQGACFIVRRSLVEQELFDPHFFLYWEEVDLALRARSAGFKILSVTGVWVSRKRNGDDRLPNALYYSARNAYLIRRKHPDGFSKPGYLVYCVSLLLIALKLLGKPRLFFDGVKGVFSGMSDGIAGRYGKRGSQRASMEKVGEPLLVPAHKGRRG